eukprot:TRINITY_DN3266_c0_g1_i1.p1 TRINITY_DN3266_c0_g1~~TRINITY_DN3266_c0_g1_i1.p1  ORF type:complete len:202 (+),score=38.76 TRINITY_DN3266_c0_g1_i1:25-606(+)
MESSLGIPPVVLAELDQNVNNNKRNNNKRKWYIKFQTMPKYVKRSNNGIRELASSTGASSDLQDPNGNQNVQPAVDMKFLDQAFAAYRKHKVQKPKSSSFSPPNSSSPSRRSSFSQADSESTQDSALATSPTSKPRSQTFSQGISSPPSSLRSSGKSPKQLRFMDVVEVVPFSQLSLGSSSDNMVVDENESSN